MPRGQEDSRKQGSQKNVEPDPRSFRARLRYVLEYRELGHEKVSELAGMGISPTHIRKWTQGTDKPYSERIEGIAKALDVSPEWLAGNQ